METQLAMVRAEENFFLEAEYIESNACSKPVQDGEYVKTTLTENKPSFSAPKRSLNMKTASPVEIPG